MHRHCRRSFLAGLAAVAAFSRARAAPFAEQRLNLATQASRLDRGAPGRPARRLCAGYRDWATLERRADERFPMCSTFKLMASAGSAQTGGPGRRAARPGTRLPAERPARVRADRENACRSRWHDARRSVRRRDRLERQHRGEPDPAGDRRTSGVRPIRALARRQCDAARPQRARFEHRDPRRRARHDKSARHGRGHATSPGRRRAFRSVPASAKGVADRRQGRRQRLRAGLPAAWRIGDKTGSGERGTTNTIAIIWPPERAPIIAAVYYRRSSAPMEARNAVHKEIGGLIAKRSGLEPPHRRWRLAIAWAHQNHPSVNGSMTLNVIASMRLRSADRSIVMLAPTAKTRDGGSGIRDGPASRTLSRTHSSDLRSPLPRREGFARRPRRKERFRR